MDIHALLRRRQSQLTVEEARRRTVEEDAAILDVREPEEWDAAQIPEAIHMPLGEPEQRLSELPRDRPLVVACRSGSRSDHGTRLLRERGYDAANLAGGIKAWQRARLPIEPPRGEIL